MEKIRILILHHTLPTNTSVITSIFDNLLPELKKFVDIHVSWVVYMPDKIDKSFKKEIDVDILDIHDFENSLELIRYANPDIVHAMPAPDFISYAFSQTAKFLKIPVFGFTGIDDDPNQGFAPSKFSLYKHYLLAFFQTSTPVDNSLQKKRFLKRGRFFIFKYYFLLKSQIAIKQSSWKIFSDFIIFLKIFLTYTKSPLNSKFSCDLNFLDNEKSVQSLIDVGFKNSTLLSTGNPMHDSIVNLHKTLNTKNKIRVLLLTSGLFEHGMITKFQRDDLFKKMVKEITKNPDMLLTIKIHPSSENIDDYKLLLNTIDPNIIIYQRGNILDFIKNTDVVIAYASDTAVFNSVLSRVPVIICNFFGLDDLFVKKRLAVECSSSSFLTDTVRTTFHSIQFSQHRFDYYAQKLDIISDGKCSKRVCSAIISLIKKHSTKN